MANIALLGKMGSQLVLGSDRMWAKVMISKYIKQDDNLDLPPCSGTSATWRGLLESINYVNGGFGWKVGSAVDVSLWFDSWLADSPLCLQVDEIHSDEILWTVAHIIKEDGQ